MWHVIKISYIQHHPSPTTRRSVVWNKIDKMYTNQYQKQLMLQYKQVNMKNSNISLSITSLQNIS